MIHHKGTNPRTGHWTACLRPVKDVADVTMDHRRTGEKGKSGVKFLPTCGAAQEKQSAAALPSLTPLALPGFFVWGVFWPLATTGAIPRTGFQAPPCTVRCTVRDGSFDEHAAGRFVLERALLATLTTC